MEQQPINYERLVRMSMRKFENTGIHEDDLFQEGMLAMMKAEQTFKPDLGVKFETYASVVVRNHLLDVIRKNERAILIEADPVPPDPPTDHKVFEMMKVVKEVLKECNPVERAIFNAYFKGYSYKEICDIFDINNKKVDNTIQKIKKRVKLQYED